MRSRAMPSGAWSRAPVGGSLSNQAQAHPHGGDAFRDRHQGSHFLGLPVHVTVRPIATSNQRRRATRAGRAQLARASAAALLQRAANSQDSLNCHEPG